MNVIKAIHAAGYIHGDIRETNVLFNLNNATMTIIDFDWLKPFNEIYNTYPEFFYSWPPECLYIFGRKKKDKHTRQYIYNINIQSLFNRNMKFITNDTILEQYEIVMNKYDYYMPYDATKGMSHFLNNTRPFRTNARNTDDINYDIEIYFNDKTNELFNITKDYIDMYGLGIAFYRLLQRAWGINVKIQGIDIDKHNNVITLADLSEGMKNGTIIMSGIDKNNHKEIEKFLTIRKFIFEDLLPGIVHSNYTKRWTIDEAIEKFKEKLDEIDKKIIEDENEEKMISDELKRLELLALLRNDKYKGFNNNNNQALKINMPYNNNSREGGKRNNKKRKTKKNKRN
jgi:serine/threonine protein kinase